MSEWRECKLGEVAEVQTGPFGSQLHQSDYKLIGTPIITVEHLGDNRIIHSNLPLVGDEDKERLNKYTLRTGDVVFSRVGSVDRCAFVHEEEDGWMFSGRLLRVRARQAVVNPRFLSFFVSQKTFKDTIRMIAVGATMPSINTEILSDVEIILPPLPEQRAIAGVLSSLDDKIDLLHRQNKTLEGMAEALWRKMFMEEADTGWIEKPLGDFFPILTGKKDANYATEDGQYPFFTCSQKILNSPDYSFDGHTILLTGNGDFNLKRYKGKFEAYQRTYVLIPYNELEVGFLYYGMRQYLDDITTGYRGSVINFITKGMIENFKLSIMPNLNIFHDACRRFNEIDNKIDSSILQIRTLSRLRDNLLPKLMSGEVRVKYN